MSIRDLVPFAKVLTIAIAVAVPGVGTQILGEYNLIHIFPLHPG
jgi:hypothetical protein